MKKLISLALLSASLVVAPAFAQSGPSGNSSPSGPGGTNVDNLGAVVAGTLLGGVSISQALATAGVSGDAMIAVVQSAIAQLEATGGAAAGPAILALNKLLDSLKKG